MLYAIFAVCGKWTLANEIPDDANLFDRILQDTELDSDEDTFAHVCDDTDESLSDKVQVTRVEAENVSFLDRSSIVSVVLSMVQHVLVV